MIERDVFVEGPRLVRAGEAEGVQLRLIGGVAVRLRTAEAVPPALMRPSPDIDLVTRKGSTARAGRVISDLGYAPHVAFNALHGQERMLFYDEANHRKLDVFVGSFRMSHAIPVAERLETDPLTIPLAELLMTKLQVFELNEKDIRDALAILYAFPVDDADAETINAALVAALCCADWGLWRTITGNVECLRGELAKYDLPPPGRERVAERLEALAERIEREPKSRSWRLRARLGERKRWYELPEEPG
jgi:hypothetical protein